MVCQYSSYTETRSIPVSNTFTPSVEHLLHALQLNRQQNIPVPTENGRGSLEVGSWSTSWLTSDEIYSLVVITGKEGLPRIPYGKFRSLYLGYELYRFLQPQEQRCQTPAHPRDISLLVFSWLDLRVSYQELGSTATSGHARTDPQPSHILICEESAITFSDRMSTVYYLYQGARETSHVFFQLQLSWGLLRPRSEARESDMLLVLIHCTS